MCSKGEAMQTIGGRSPYSAGMRIMVRMLAGSTVEKKCFTQFGNNVS